MTSRLGLVTIGLVLALAARAHATPLGDLAAGMTPGSWAELETENLAPCIKETLGIGATGSIFPYSEDGVWEPATGQFFFVGSDHIYDGTSSSPRFIAYREDDNGWRIMPQPAWLGPGTRHGYDHSAILGGALYHITVIRGQPLWRYDPAAGTWDPRAALDEGAYNRFGGLEPFPELGGLIYVHAGELYLFAEGSNSWSRLADGLAMGDYHNFAEFNPVHRVAIFGGGNQSGAIHVIDASGNLSVGTAAPFSLRVNQAIVTVDPLSGDYLVFGGSGEFYVYDVTADSWALQAGAVPIFGSGTGEPVALTIAGPIDTYGVVMFVKQTGIGDSAAGEVWLYKHAPGSGPGRPDGGVLGDGGSPPDGDGGGAGPEAGAAADGAPGDGPPGTTGDGHGGCGCRAASRPGPAIPWLAWCAATAGARIWRRRRSRPGRSRRAVCGVTPAAGGRLE